MGDRTWIDVENEGLAGFLRLLVRDWRWWAILAVCGGILALAVCLVLPVRWQATSTIVPSSILAGKGQNMPLGSLASGLTGMNLLFPGGQEASSALYPSILESRTVGEQALSNYFMDSQGRSLTMAERLVPDEPDSARRHGRGLKKLREALTVKLDRKSKVTSVIVTLGDPRVAAELANFLVARLDSFSRSAQNLDAFGQFEFINARVAEARSSLDVAEAALMDFEASNRQWPSSPQLSLKHDRLAREVLLGTELFVTLKTQLGMAQIEAAKNLPLIAVIDHASIPDTRSSPRTGKITVAVFFLFLALGILVVLVRNSLRSPGPVPADRTVG